MTPATRDAAPMPQDPRDAAMRHGAGGPAEVAGDGLDPARILGALRRRLPLLLATIVIGTVAAGLLTMQLSPSYSASATLVVEPQTLRVLDSRDGTDEDSGGEAIATQVSVLSSRGHARRVVERLELTRLAAFQPQPGLVDRVQRMAATAADRVAAQLGAATANSAALGADAPPPRPRALADRATAYAVDALRDRLSVHRDGESRAVVVQFSAGDAALAAEIVNSLVDIHLEVMVAKKADALEATERWARARVETLREELIAMERRAERYRVTHDLLENRDGTLDSQQLAALNAQLISARAERQAAEAKLARIRQVRNENGDPGAIGEIVASPLMAELRRQQAELERREAQLAQEYGERHPRMQEIEAERAEIRRRLDDEIGRIVGGLADEVALARAREQAIEAGLGEAKGETAEAQQASVELRELEREVTARRGVYEALLGRLQEIQEQRDLLRPDARVISDAAIPDAPSFPKPGLIIVVGFIGSMGLGLLLVTVAELRDRSLRSRHEVEQALGLPTLAMVPAIEKLRKGETPAGYLAKRPASAYAEALRELEAVQRAGHQAGGGAAGGQVVLITSSLPGEGKTSLATSLALTAARAGRRTILVDLDMRHPSVAPALELPSMSRSIARMLDLLVLGEAGRQAPRTDLVRPDTIERLIAQLRASYDLVIIDTAPLLGLADTKAIAGLADQVLFVIRWGMTQEAAARSAVEALAGVGARIAGTVLTRVDMRRHARYGYGDASAYYHSFKQYYAN